MSLFIEVDQISHIQGEYLTQNLVPDIPAEESELEPGKKEEKTTRELAAPIPISLIVNAIESAIANYSIADFKNLPPIDEVKKEDYYGPIGESNLVIPGSLIVGAFPGSAYDTENTNNLINILNCGITMFVCMQLEYNPDAPEYMWRTTGKSIRPYFKDVQKIMENKHEYASLIAETGMPTFVHCPIRDCSIVADDVVFNLAIKLAQAIRDGEILYLHCWGGHGRTGVVVCLILHLLYGLTADEAIERCELVHMMRRMPCDVGSPQTPAQVQQVRRIITSSFAKQNNGPDNKMPNVATVLNFAHL